MILLMTIHSFSHLIQEEGDTEEALSSKESNNSRHLRGWASLRKLQLPLR